MCPDLIHDHGVTLRDHGVTSRGPSCPPAPPPQEYVCFPCQPSGAALMALASLQADRDTSSPGGQQQQQQPAPCLGMPSTALSTLQVRPTLHAGPCVMMW